MNKEEFVKLTSGDVVSHVNYPHIFYNVTANFGKRKTGVRTIDITNPQEWNLVAKANIKSVGPVTTLFFMGPQQRDWGFLVNRTKQKTQWIQWEHYLTNYKDYHKRYIEPKMQMALSRKKP